MAAMPTHRTPTKFQRQIGGRLRRARKEKGLKAHEVSQLLGCSQQNYEFLEMGYNRLTIEKVFEVAPVLGYEPRDLASRLFHPDPSEDQTDDAPAVSEDRNREPESFEVPAGMSRKVDIGRVMSGRKMHPSQGPLIRLATA